MDIRKVMVTSFLVLAVSATAIAGEPYAPKVKAPTGIKPFSIEDFDVMGINAAVVPEKSAVEIPPYPGARVLSTISEFKMTINKKKVTCLSSIKLLSTDPVDKVVAFYKEKLKEYRYKSMWDGMINFFWIGGKDDNMLDIKKACVTLYISISSADSKMMPKAKTEIQLTYGAKK